MMSLRLVREAALPSKIVACDPYPINTYFYFGTKKPTFPKNLNLMADVVAFYFMPQQRNISLWKK